MLRFSNVMDNANKEFEKLCKEDGRFETEIYSLQLKAVVKALVGAINDESTMIQEIIERNKKASRRS